MIQTRFSKVKLRGGFVPYDTRGRHFNGELACTLEWGERVTRCDGVPPFFWLAVVGSTSAICHSNEGVSERILLKVGLALHRLAPYKSANV